MFVQSVVGTAATCKSRLALEVKSTAKAPGAELLESQGQACKTAVGTGNTQVQAWEVESRKFVRAHGYGGGDIQCIAFLPDNERVIFGQAQGNVWTASAKDPGVGNPPMVVAQGNKPVYAIAAAADGRTAILGSSDGIVQLLNVETARGVGRLVGCKDDVLGMRGFHHVAIDGNRVSFIAVGQVICKREECMCLITGQVNCLLIV